MTRAQLPPRPRARLAGVLAAVAAVVVTALAAVPAAPSAQAAPSVDAAGRGPTLDFAQVSAGGEHSCGVKADGSLWCWGRNTWGQVGNGGRTDVVTTPTRVGSGSSWAQVSAGGATTCAVRTNGRLFCWGLNNRGQLGDGTREVRPSPHRVPGKGWASVSASWYNTCAVRKDGAAWCWGDNSAGQLGRGNYTQTLGRVKLDGSDWTSVTSGGWHTCGLREGGSLWCWGRNLFGQVGDGTYAVRTKPVRVGGERRWAEVDASWTHTCARTRSGTAWCWGRNTRGGLGNGGTASSNRPVQVDGGHQARSIATYEGGACLVDTDEVAWCWGDNLYGQAGGADETTAQPRRRRGTYTSVDGGWNHVCGSEPGGEVTCWGNNERKQLGGAVRTQDRAAVLGADDTGGDADAERPQGAEEPLELRIATFNVLGEHHSAPYRDADRFAPSRIRAEWTAQAILNDGMDVVGIQEPSLAQVNAIQRASGGRLAAFPDAGDKLSTETTLLWDQRRFEVLKEKPFRTQFIERKLPRPLVQLRDKATGRTFWVMAIHNAPWDYQRQRNEAVKVQLAKINELEDDSPVFYVGDFNEKKTILCKVLRQTDLVTPIGGRLKPDGTCVTPRLMRVDWVFGPSSADYSRFSFSRPPLVAMSTDHYVPVTDVRVP